ncbi:MAG: hypothetical protein IPP68_00230 [Elusimicrobia bacterium]|nr:hypothetical protein [Elusimicrobiota bacterium]
MRTRALVLLAGFFALGCVHRAPEVLGFFLFDTLASGRTDLPDPAKTVSKDAVLGALKADKSHPDLQAYDFDSLRPMFDLNLMCNEKQFRFVGIELSGKLKGDGKAILWLYETKDLPLQTNPAASALQKQGFALKSLMALFQEGSFWSDVCGGASDTYTIKMAPTEGNGKGTQ